MAEIVLKLIEVFLHAAFDGMTQKMGQRILARYGIKSNSFLETLIGLLCWMLIGLVLFFAGAAVLASRV
jgi:hypothetical protein